MRNTRIRSLLLFILLFQVGFGQFNYSGEITPNALIRISDAGLIDLPFRLGNIELNYSTGDFEFKTLTAIETRWKDAEYSADMFELREAFVMWYPSFGEVKLGKMIHAWGAADGNNPTDNLSPYDFYYMFLSGTDRKIGNLSLSAKGYLGDWQAELVYTPEHMGNRLPFNEPDFPIEFPFEPSDYLDVDSPGEIGLRVQRAFDAGDVSLSALKTHDFAFSPIHIAEVAPHVIMPEFGYRNTNVLGFDFVAFPGNWTLRGEGALFSTSTPDSAANALKVFPVEADYFQYVLQVEYEFANQVTFMGQILGTQISNADGLLMNPLDPSQNIALNEDNFIPGLGTPFAMIADQVAIMSTMVTMFDSALELTGMVMFNLEETGTMLNLGSDYSISDGLNVETRMAYFIGGDEEGNSFKRLEDFSNISLGLSYSF